MSAEHQSEQYPDILPVIITGEQAQAVQELAERFHLSVEDMASGLISVGEAMLNAMDADRDPLLARYDRNGNVKNLGTINFARQASKYPTLIPFALVQAQIKNR